MQIPSYARPHFQEYQQTGKLAALDSTMELSREGVDAFEGDFTRELQQARDWDETDRDDCRGQVGVVRVRDPLGAQWGGVVEATFTDHELYYRNSVPDYTGGYESVSLTRFTGDTMERVGMSASISGEVTNPNLVHLNVAEHSGYVLYQGA